MVLPSIGECAGVMRRGGIDDLDSPVDVGIRMGVADDERGCEHSAANLGVPDLLFFALFLAAAARYGLRIAWTWVALVASFGLTIALAVKLGLAGLPALPGVALGFLLPNADRLWSARATPDRGPSP